MKDFTRDPAALAVLEADPLTLNETQPAATVAALARVDERLRDSFGSITLPVLILHGTEDRATICHGSEFFHEHAGSRDKTLKIYQVHYHDLLNDIGKEEVFRDIAAWIEQWIGKVAISRFLVALTSTRWSIVDLHVVRSASLEAKVESARDGVHIRILSSP